MSNSSTHCKLYPCKLFCMQKKLRTLRTNFTPFVAQMKESICGFFPYGWYGSSSPWYTANQPAILVCEKWCSMQLYHFLIGAFFVSVTISLLLYISIWGAVAARWLGHCCALFREAACWICLLLLGCWLIQHLCSFNCLLVQPQAERNELLHSDRILKSELSRSEYESWLLERLLSCLNCLHMVNQGGKKS